MEVEEEVTTMTDLPILDSCHEEWTIDGFKEVNGPRGGFRTSLYMTQNWFICRMREEHRPPAHVSTCSMVNLLFSRQFLDLLAQTPKDGKNATIRVENEESGAFFDLTPGNGGRVALAHSNEDFPSVSQHSGK